jgi:hypothetical protein
MGIFSIFKKSEATPLKEQPASPISNIENDYQMVIVQFFYGIEDISELHHMEERLRQLIHETGVGQYHGHEISLDFGDGYLFILGPNAEKIYTCVKPLLESYYFMDKSIATVRSGSFEKATAVETDYPLRYHKFHSN